MEKWLCWGSLAVAGLMLALFALDFFIGIPFGGAGLAGMKTVDIFGIIASGVLLYMSYNAIRDLR